MVCIVEFRKAKDRILQHPGRWSRLLNPMSSDGKEAVNSGCLPCIACEVDFTTDIFALSDRLAKIKKPISPYIKTLTEVSELFLKEINDLSMSGFAVWDNDTICRLRSSVNHLL